jgi:hypothetical protein
MRPGRNSCRVSGNSCNEVAIHAASAAIHAMKLLFMREAQFMPRQRHFMQ